MDIDYTGKLIASNGRGFILNSPAFQAIVINEEAMRMKSVYVRERLRKKLAAKKLATKERLQEASSQE
jgi:hypothetical protein